LNKENEEAMYLMCSKIVGRFGSTFFRARFFLHTLVEKGWARRRSFFEIFFSKACAASPQAALLLGAFATTRDQEKKNKEEK
jgi:hypothetical protein